MALKKTQLLDIQSVTGIATVGIFTVGVTQTAGGVGVASTSYIKTSSCTTPDWEQREFPCMSIRT